MPLISVYNYDSYEPLDITVEVELHSQHVTLTCHYPKQLHENNTQSLWKDMNFKSLSDGTLIYTSSVTKTFFGTPSDDEIKQKKCNSLFWSGETVKDLSLLEHECFCIAGKNCATFLETALTQYGLNTKEKNDMITLFYLLWKTISLI